jgi:hypothetical protein
MAAKKYTQCYNFAPENWPTSKPFNESDLGTLAIVHVIQALVLTGAGAVIGLAFGGVGVIVGVIVGFIVGVTTAVATAIHSVADQWLKHRLICLGDKPKCAVGTVTEGPKYGDLGDFDNDEFFDVILMPHRIEDNYVELFDPASPQTESPFYGNVAPSHAGNIHDHPNNEIYVDGLQGEALLKPSPALLSPRNVGYNNEQKNPEELHTASMLHCEAEGDFWVRMKELAVALGLLATVVAAAAVAGAVAGGYAGAVAGCAILTVVLPFLPGLACILGAIIGGAIGAAAGAAIAGALPALIGVGVLQAIFDADPGEVEDANVGDKKLGEIIAGSRVAVLGEHVYDGFHAGWHEFHPLLAVMKIEPDVATGKDSSLLTWNPAFRDGDPFPKDLPGMPPGILDLKPDDMRQGLNSPKFASRAKWLRDKWCDMLTIAHDPHTRTTQSGLVHRWTIHPDVDGCEPHPDPAPGPDPGPH